MCVVMSQGQAAPLVLPRAGAGSPGGKVMPGDAAGCALLLTPLLESSLMLCHPASPPEPVGRADFLSQQHPEHARACQDVLSHRAGGPAGSQGCFDGTRFAVVTWPHSACCSAAGEKNSVWRFR